MKDNFDIFDNLTKAVSYEIYIRNKKEKGKKLTNEELFYDLYLIKPSTIITLLNKIIGDK